MRRLAKHQLTLNTEKIVLNGTCKIPVRLYDHFMPSSMALSILGSPALTKKYNLYAEELLTFFVKQGELLNGSDFLVYNVHLPVQLASDANHYGRLDECSAFRFESYLQQLKRLVHSGGSHLSQVSFMAGCFLLLATQNVKVKVKKEAVSEKESWT